MTLEIVKSIRKSEDEAEKIIADSIIKSREIISEAERQKNDILKKAFDDAERESSQLLKNMEIAVQREVEDILDKAHEDGENMRSHVMLKLNKAVNIVVERIVEGHGNS